ncbi:MAG: MBL fold metallo-hydrolase [Xanthobacteraceae bacterium]|jgi:L-ascorbate metabolism protein UlaG (beta-lactamase superfamily)
MNISRWIIRFVLAAIAHSILPSLAIAQPAAPSNPEMTQACPGLVAGNHATAIPAAWQMGAANLGGLNSGSFNLAALNSDQVRLTFLGHATFLIESPQLVRIATDYNDYVKPPVLPDIVTMNHAHDTHYTEHPSPAIKYVLRGWGMSPEQPAIWDLKYRDVRVRNVPTNIRSFYGSTTTERYGNSIFIFEIANLCIAHLGHLHHTLTQQQLNEIGRIDVVMAPVDGSYTLDLDGMMEVLTALKTPLIIPMHYYGQYILDRFLDRARKLWDVETAEIPSVVVSKATLPAAPKVLVLPGRF